MIIISSAKPSFVCTRIYPKQSEDVADSLIMRIRLAAFLQMETTKRSLQLEQLDMIDAGKIFLQ